MQGMIRIFGGFLLVALAGCASHPTTSKAPVAAEPEIAKLLKIPAAAPILLVERVSFTYGERPVELRRGFCLTEHHHYHNTLS